jgi:hypothetical protein
MDSGAFVALFMVAVIAPAWPASASAGPGGDDAFLGRWDITATGTKSGLPRNCWLELRRDGGVLKGRFNAGGGAVFDLQQVMIENGELGFQYPQGKPPNQTQQVWQAKVKDSRLVGIALVNGQTLSWTGVRGPVWPATPPKRTPGKPIDLFNGKDVSGWLCQDPRHPMGWFVKDGILMNEGNQACNIYTQQKFNDFKLDVEFNVDPQSNSGVYLRGRYEIQILDGYDRPMDVHSQGALYGFIVPTVKADKPAGQWQTFEITLIANRVTVIENGTKIIDNAEVSGITGGALDANEKGTGPIMLQGDHGKVQFRKVRITPLI